MAQPLLEGQVYEAPIDRVQELRGEFEDFQRQMRDAMSRIVGQVNTIRSGLHIASGDEITTVPVGNAPQFDPKWKAWLDKFSDTAPARVITALLDHGPMNRSQLRVATAMGWSTLDAATSRLKNLNLIEKSGDRWNLKG